MATPLSELLNAVLTDAGAREQFQLAPEAFLRSAGYRDLDAADVQEALFVLADGSEPVRAGQLLAGGRAIGDPGELDGLTDGGLATAGQGLAAAIDTMPLDDPTGPEADDPATTDDPFEETAFGSGTAETGEIPDVLDHDTLDTTSADLDTALEQPIDELDELHDLAEPDQPLDDLSRSDDDADDDAAEPTLDDWDLD